MSHGKLRTEKNCLNCNAQVSDRFCGICGQENIEPKETFWQLVSHFVYDLFHYDGKALSTLKTLIFNPGLLTHEYVRGRRASYLHPIRLYIFISAVFFIIFLSFIAGRGLSTTEANQFTSVQKGSLEKTVNQLKDSLAVTSDSTKKKSIQNQIIALEKVNNFFSPGKDDTVFSVNENAGSPDNLRFMLFNQELPKSIKDYKAEQLKLPPAKRDSWFKRSIKYKILDTYNKYQYNSKGFKDALVEHFLHSLPTMMFISLPVAALIFSLVYIRRLKQFTYVQHGVFLLHIYSAVFVFILCLNVLGLLNDYLHWEFLSVLKSVGVLFIFYYIYKAMRNFYEQRRIKTLLKYFLLLFSYSFVLIFLMIIFLLTSLIQI